MRAAEPTAQVIYLEPDIYRADYVPAERPEPPAARRALSPAAGPCPARARYGGPVEDSRPAPPPF